MTRRAIPLLLLVLGGCGLRDVPTHPGSGYALLGSVATVGIGQDIVVRNGTAYVVEGEVGLATYDVSDPSSPVPMDALHLPNGYCRGVALVDTLAVVAAGEYAGLMLYSVSRPEELTFLGAVGVEQVQSPVDVVAVPGIAYVADKWGGLAVYGIENPGAPHFFDRAETDGYAMGVEIVDTLAYVACGQAGLEIVNIRNPHGPEVLAQCDSPGYGYDVVTRDGVAYLADGQKGVLVIDATDLADPHPIGGYDTQGQAIKLFLKWPLLYVADDWGGLTVLDVTDPTDPGLHSGYDTDGAMAVWVDDGGVVYLVTEYDGLLVLRTD
jgi:hypothetical protein